LLYFIIFFRPLVAYRPLQQPPNPIKSLETAVSNLSLAKALTKTPVLTPKPTPSPMPIVDLPTPVIPKEPELSENWRDHLLPRGEEFFECRVTFMETDGPIWVVHVANVESMERLTDNMQRCMQNQKRCGKARASRSLKFK